MVKILFVCKHNRFRSKVAEAIFNKLNKNGKTMSESAGVLIDELRPYIADNVKEIMKDKGYEIKGSSRLVDKENIDDFEEIVIVADNVDREDFKGFRGNLIKWEIRDSDENDLDRIKMIVDDIEGKIRMLLSKEL